MSRHVSRRDRWSQHGPIEYRCPGGLRVFYERGAWWAEVIYRLRIEAEGPPVWEGHTERLGPFKRPRNAQVEAERYATYLQRHHGERVAF